jgi:hypothetical protein
MESDIDWHRIAKDLTNRLEQRHARIAVLEARVEDYLQARAKAQSRIAALEAELVHKDAYYAQFDLTPRATPTSGDADHG